MTDSQVAGVNSSSSLSKPNRLRSTSAPESAYCGMALYSTVARSGAPLPALIAFWSLVYCSAAVPTFSTLTLIFGYFFSNASATSGRLPDQDQTVSSVGLSRAARISFSPTDAGPEPSPVSPPPQADRVTAVRTVPRRRAVVLR